MNARLSRCGRVNDNRTAVQPHVGAAVHCEGMRCTQTQEHTLAVAWTTGYASVKCWQSVGRRTLIFGAAAPVAGFACSLVSSSER